MKVLVTGGAGFIGSNFVHFALQNRPDWNITVLDLLTYAGNLENIKGPLEEKQIEFERLDIADFKAVSELLERSKFDLIVHFAAESHVDRSIHSAGPFVKTNVLGTQNLIDAAIYNKVSRFVHVSTDEVYGSLGPTGRFVETTPLDPSSAYSASKASSDLLVLAACKTHGFDGIVTRCTNNYGPYQFPEKLIPLFVTNAYEDKPLPLYGDGMNIRSWLYVDDHCDALIAVAEKGRAGEVYNIGGMQEAEIPNVEVTRSILRIMNKSEDLITKVADRLGHDRRYAIDYGKINGELGWKPKVPFETGLKKTIEWYLDNESWWRRIKSGEYQEYYEQNYGQRA